MANETDIRKYFEFAKELTLEAGKIFQSGFSAEKVVDVKGAHYNVVTNYDHKIEELIVNTIKQEYPDHRIIAEETVGDVKNLPGLTDDPTWFLDPIDGTVNFIHQLPYTCISLGLAIRKELVIGIIYNPVISEHYTAIKGGGAFLNGKPMHVSKIKELKHTLISVEQASLAITSTRDITMGRFVTFAGKVQGIRSMGSAAMDMAYTARGILDCYQSDGLYPWDLAAGILLVREAGGTVIDIYEDKINLMKPRVIAASHKELAFEVKKIITETDLKTLRKRLTRT